MTFHSERDGGKVVPLEVVTKYIFDNHEHYGSDGVAMVESVSLEKFLLVAAIEINEELVETVFHEVHAIDEDVDIDREEVRMVIETLKNVLEGKVG